MYNEKLSRMCLEKPKNKYTTVSEENLSKMKRIMGISVLIIYSNLLCSTALQCLQYVAYFSSSYRILSS